MLRICRAAAAALVLLLAPAAAAARAFTLDDLLRQESFGDVVLDPTGRWLAIARRDPYETAARFDLDQHNATALTRLLVVDLARPSPARPLLPAYPPGQTVGAFSPAGERLAVLRLDGGRGSLTVVTLATGEARDFDVAPELALEGRALQWRSETELLLLQRPDGTPAWPLRLGHLAADTLPPRWAATAAGAGAWSVLGSGADRTQRPRPPPNALIRLDVRSGARQVLARGDFVDLELSPDGGRVALREAGEDLQPRADRPLHGDWGIATQAQRISLLDLQTGARRTPCPDCDALPHLLSWSPDGAGLLIYARARGEPWSAGALRRLDARTGEVRRLGDGLRPLVEGRPEVIRAGWMGADPVVLARPAAAGAGGRADWFRLTPAGPVNLTRALAAPPRDLAALDRAGLAVLADGGAWRIDPRGGAARLAAPATDARGPRTRVEGRLYFAPPTRSWTITGGRDRRRLLRLDARGLTPVLDLPPGTGPLLAASRTHQAAVWRRRDAQGVETLMLAARGGVIPLSRVNAALADVAPPRVRAIAHRGPDGQALTSWLFLPPAATAQPPPLVVRAYSGNVYGGAPTPAPPIAGLMTDIRPLTAHGYAVLVPSLPVPRARRDEPMAGLAERILAVVDRAAAAPETAGAFDPQRVALWGHSFGGYTVMGAITQSDRFRAAVAISGISDLLGKWGSFPPALRALPEAGVQTAWSAGWVESVQGGMGAPPWSDPARYARNSPLLAADRVATPLLLMHGDQDGMPLAQAEAMFSALYRQDKDAILVTYWGEGHHIASPGNVRDAYARAFRFLDAHLAADPGREAVKPAAAAPPLSPGPGPASGAPRPPPPRR